MRNQFVLPAAAVVVSGVRVHELNYYGARRHIKVYRKSFFFANYWKVLSTLENQHHH